MIDCNHVEGLEVEAGCYEDEWTVQKLMQEITPDVDETQSRHDKKRTGVGGSTKMLQTVGS